MSVFRPSKRLAKAFAKRSNLVLDMSRTVDHGTPGIFRFSGKPDPQKMREIVSETLMGAFTALAYERGKDRDRYPLTQGRRRFRDEVRREALIHFHLSDDRSCRRLMDRLCEEFTEWLRVQCGLVWVDPEGYIKAFMMDRDDAVVMIGELQPSEWSRDPVRTGWKPSYQEGEEQ